MEQADVLIIGGGPAGLNAAMYAARKELSAILVTPDVGGQMLLTGEIENYLGFPAITGFELADKMESHVKKYPVQFETANVKSLRKVEDGTFEADLDDGKTVSGKTCIVTAGKKSRTLNILGEKEFSGRGVSYCATCDGPFYKGKVIAVVGGGDSAVQAAIELSKIGTKVYLLVRSRIRAAEIIVKRMEECENVEVIMPAIPLRIEGDKRITRVVIRHTDTDEEESLEVGGLFVEAGGIPNSTFLPKEVELNKEGEIMTDKAARTSVEGLFAAGDVTDCANKQIIIAAGEGATAALSAHEYLLRSGL